MITRSKLSHKMAENIDEELKLIRKIDRFMVENELKVLFDVSDVKEAIEELKILIDSYDDLHVRLKRELGDEHYNASFRIMMLS